MPSLMENKQDALPPTRWLQAVSLEGRVGQSPSFVPCVGHVLREQYLQLLDVRVLLVWEASQGCSVFMCTSARTVCVWFIYIFIGAHHAQSCTR
jgi:hypothetical protein